ncbi:MAG TPA: MBL fold metallo-hydrolase [Gemmatimonadaceae bacterium]|nr:MBL fold metallo-hydrolase [Gemmatimonadaceae bacterium]
MTMRASFPNAIATVCAIALASTSAGAQSAKRVPAMPSDFANWTTEQVAPGIYAFIAPDGVTPIVSGNSTVIIGDSAVAVVDAGQFPSVARAQIAALRKLTSKPVRYLINSHWHPDHWVGNAEYAKAFPGIAIISTHVTRELAVSKAIPFMQRKFRDQTADVVKQMLASGKRPDSTPLPPEQVQYYRYALTQLEELSAELDGFTPVPPNVLFSDTLTLLLGGREVRVMWLGRANTGGDAITYVPDAKVLMTGDLVVHPYPYAIGAFIGEWIETMQKLEAIDAAVIIPGHGAVERDKSYLMLVSKGLTQLQTQASALQKQGLALADARKKADFSALRTEMCGNDSWCVFGFNAAFAGPGFARAYREAKDGKLNDED